MIYLVALVVLVLATARLTRLIYFDDLTMPFRRWVDARFGPNSVISRIVWCPWCASVWAAIFLCPMATTALWVWGGWPLGAAIVANVLLIPAVSYPAGWLVDWETSRTGGEK